MNWFVKNRFSNQVEKKRKFDTNIQSDIFIDGYVIPRTAYYENYKHLNQEELIKQLHEQYKEKFIHYIKGVFTIIVFYNKGFQIFSDRHSLKKYFIYQNENEFYISNSMTLISEKYKLEIDNEQAALFSLTSHFFNGNTLFKYLKSNKPAEHVIFNRKSLEITNYWSPGEIFKINPTKQNTEKYAQHWAQNISSYINYLLPKNISVTLTGGNDSRMVVAALLSLKKSFHCFTFGNPLSYDGVVSSQLKESATLNHHFYNVENPNKHWFQKQANELVGFGQGLINIHRTHRNDAIQNEKKQVQDTEMIFTGLVGGEYFKEPFYDDITIPKIFEKIIKSKEETESIKIISEELRNKGLNLKNVNLESIYTQIKSFIDYGNALNQKEQKFVYTYLFYGCAHHTQDSNVFGQHIKYVVNPFMDIDFIEMIASHPAWYVNKKLNLLNRFFHSEFFISITHNLAPQLSHIPYAKKGKYTARDLLNHKLVYLIKRFSYLIKKDRNCYPANFPMGEWLYQFCSSEINKLSPEIENLFNLKQLRNQLNLIKNKTTEKSWHVITNPINLNLIYEQYKTY